MIPSVWCGVNIKQAMEETRKITSKRSVHFLQGLTKEKEPTGTIFNSSDSKH